MVIIVPDIHSSPPDFYLYHTLGCHLCEEAEVIVQAVASMLQLTFARLDIADEDSLIELYGIRIPVLYHLASGNDLGWPFDMEKAHDFMEQQCWLS